MLCLRTFLNSLLNKLFCMKRIGLGFSGGGYRAAIYHLGTLKKLKELKILDRVDVISSISGGSITSGLYGLYGENFTEFEERLLKGVKSNIIFGVLLSWNFILFIVVLLSLIGLSVYLLFTSMAYLSFLILILILVLIYFFQFIILPISKIVESLYNRYFFNKKNLSDLSLKPTLAINSTNLETVRQFSFSQTYMGDSKYLDGKSYEKKIEFNCDSFPLARAVSASACVPFGFTPISISRKYYKDPSDYNLIEPKLIDGGVYDNQGIHKLTQESDLFGCEIIIVSDAGTKEMSKRNYINTLDLLVRTSDIFLRRIKNVQLVKDVYHNFQFDKREIAYQSLGWDVQNCINGFVKNLFKGLIIDSIIKAHGITKEEIKNEDKVKVVARLKENVGYEKILANSPTNQELKIARSVTTGLSTLKDIQINALIKQASSITELQVKLYCPSLIVK